MGVRFEAAVDPRIDVADLRIAYRTRTREAGSALRRKAVVEAVRGVSFSLDAGEIVGFLGSNGAGKTSVIKSLCGLIQPASGVVRVLGTNPFRREPRFLRQITVVMGHRQQLLWDLPAVDTFLANKAIYGISDTDYRRTTSDLVDVLGLAGLLAKPVRQLSLGERIRCELAAGLLHEPRVLFLDEPTLGLDVQSQQAVRDFITHYRERRRSTILLASHDMADIVDVVSRVLLIDEGRLRYDGSLVELVDRVATESVIRVRAPHAPLPRIENVLGVWREGDHILVRAPRTRVPAVVSTLLDKLNIFDLTVTPPSAEDVLRAVIVGDVGQESLTESSDAQAPTPADAPPYGAEVSDVPLVDETDKTLRGVPRSGSHQ